MEESENESVSESNKELNQKPALNFMQTPAFDDLTDPVSVYLGFLPDSLQLPDDFDKNIVNKAYEYADSEVIDSLMDKLVQKFNEHGIKAARFDKPFDDKENNIHCDALDPGTIMVTPTGIQSPLITPEDAKTAAMIYGTIINETPGLKTYGYANSVSLEQMAEPLMNFNELDGSSPKKEPQKFTEQICVHPHPEEAEKILEERGWDKMTKSQLTSLIFEEAEKLPLFMMGKNENNNPNVNSFPNKYTVLYSGKPYPQAHLVIAASENLYITYTSPNVEDASVYPLCSPEGKRYAFMNTYDFTSLNLFYNNAEYEKGIPPATEEKNKYETPVTPQHNKHIDTYLVIANPDGSREFRKIPTENDPGYNPEQVKLWKDIMELHRPSLPSKNLEETLRRFHQKQLGADGGLYICDAMGNPTNRNKILHKVNGKYQIDYITPESRDQSKEAIEKNKQPQENNKEDALNKIAILSGRSPESLKNSLSANKQHQQQKTAEASQADQTLNNKNSNKDAENIKILRGLAPSNDQNKPNNDNNRQITQTNTMTDEELLQEQLKQKLKDGGR